MAINNLLQKISSNNKGDTRETLTHKVINWGYFIILLLGINSSPKLELFIFHAYDVPFDMQNAMVTNAQTN